MSPLEADATCDQHTTCGGSSGSVTTRGHHEVSGDADFLVVAEAWDQLPTAVRVGIVEMVRACRMV